MDASGIPKVRSGLTVQQEMKLGEVPDNENGYKSRETQGAQDVCERKHVHVWVCAQVIEDYGVCLRVCPAHGDLDFNSMTQLWIKRPLRLTDISCFAFPVWIARKEMSSYSWPVQTRSSVQNKFWTELE